MPPADRLVRALARVGADQGEVIGLARLCVRRRAFPALPGVCGPCSHPLELRQPDIHRDGQCRQGCCPGATLGRGAVKVWRYGQQVGDLLGAVQCQFETDRVRRVVCEAVGYG